MNATSDPMTIRSELLNILVAGRDTTAGVLVNIFFELPRYPDVISRLRQEIKEHVGEESPTYEQLKGMKYLKAIINEIQRLYPILPINAREAIIDTVLPRGGGPDGDRPVAVMKGGLVLFVPYAMHRREDIYGPDAETFRPSRWLDDDNKAHLRPGWAYLPFGGGPRICLGQQFALMQIAYVTVRLFQRFQHIESRSTEPWREKMTIICGPLGGCKVGLKENDEAEARL
jgi:cytochrome P450